VKKKSKGGGDIKRKKYLPRAESSSGYNGGTSREKSEKVRGPVEKGGETEEVKEGRH